MFQHKPGILATVNDNYVLNLLPLQIQWWKEIRKRQIEIEIENDEKSSFWSLKKEEGKFGTTNKVGVGENFR